MNVDAIICPQDDFCLSKGRIAKTIANASNERYCTDVIGMKTVKRSEVKKITASPITLPFKYVLHTVAPRWDKDAVKDNAKFLKELGLTIRNILKHCSDSKNISTAAIPVLGIGKWKQSLGLHIGITQFVCLSIRLSIRLSICSSSCQLHFFLFV